MHDEFCKNEIIEKMTDNLRVLRNKLELTQDELAGKIGISRQTIVNIENKKRVMTWNTFMALVTVFRAKQDTSNLLDYFGIYTIDLNKYLTQTSQLRKNPAIISIFRQPRGSIYLASRNL